MTRPRVLTAMTMLFAAAAGAVYDHVAISLILGAVALTAFGAEETLRRRRG